MRLRFLPVLAVAALVVAAPAAAQQVLEDLIVAVTNDRAADVRRWRCIGWR